MAERSKSTAFNESSVCDLLAVEEILKKSLHRWIHKGRECIGKGDSLVETAT